ncbi:MAG: glycosyltransferase family 4 protein [Nitrospira sp.]|nr:glycosyltransferase family 4 protein [Nitrospira sp.]
MNLAVVTNILTPYRLPLFAAIGKRVDRLHVLLMADREENRDWMLETALFQHEILPGFHLKFPGAEVSMHVNHGVMRALRRVNPDVVLSGGFAPANLTAWLYCRLHGRAFVGWGELSMQDVANTPLLKRGLRRMMTSWSEGAIASSSEARDVFLHFGAPTSNILTAIMPIDVEYFHTKAMAWRNSEWFTSERARYSSPILLSVGRLTERKGYRELFKIYEVLVKQRPDVSLLIVGDGPDRAMHESHVRSQNWKHVHFLGFRQTDEVVKYLALADLFIFHTLLDPFGAVLSEAMAAELPVISSIHAAATKDLVDDGVTGFRIDPKHAEQSAQVLLRVLAITSSERAALGRAAYERVRCHDIDITAEHMVDFLNSLGQIRPQPTARRMPVEPMKGP